MIVLKYEQNHRLNRVGCLLLAAHFLFVFCAVDLLHTDDCPCVNGIPIDADDGCVACQFKSGVHAEQPEFLDSLVPSFFLEHQVVALAEIVQNNELTCSLQPRAPPV